MNIKKILKEEVLKIIDERDDINTARNYQFIADNIIKEFLSNIEKYINYYYPEKIVNPDFLLNQYYQQLQYFGAVIKQVKFDGVTVHFSFKNVSSDGEYKPTTKEIFIYNDDITGRLADILHNVKYYLDTEDRFNISNRKQTRRQVLECYEYLKKYNYQQIKYVLVHEITHFFDFKTKINNDKLQSDFQKQLRKYSNLTKDQFEKIKQDVYVNANHEYNAYFLDSTVQILDYLDGRVPRWDIMVRLFNQTYPHLHQVNQETKQRFLKRLYALWSTLKEAKEKELGRSMNENIQNLKLVGYHVTSQHNLKSIKSIGLEPRVPEDFGVNGDMKGVYLFKTREDAENALFNWLGERIEEYEEETNKEYKEVLLYVNLEGLEKYLIDSVEYEWTCTVHIEPSRIIKVEKLY